MYLGIGLGITRLSGVLGFNPASLFASGEVGAWYDPSDSSTVFQDAAGTTPATVGDPVGLILDKSQGLVLGSELVTNGTFESDTAWTKGTGWSISSGLATKSPGTGSNLEQVYAFTAGQWYRLTFDVVRRTNGAMQIQIGGGTALSVTGFVFWAEGTHSVYFTPNSGNSILRFVAGSTLDADIDNVSLVTLSGNHATQATPTARPTLQTSGGLYYLDFDGSDDWLRTTFSANQAQPNTLAAAFKFDQGSRNEFVVDGVSTDRNAIYKTTTDLQLFAGSSITDPSAAGTTELVALGHLNTTSSELRVDGSQVVTGDVGSNQWGGVTLGADSSDTLWLDGRIYGFIGINRTLTANEIDGVESYLATKSGVTL